MESSSSDSSSEEEDLMVLLLALRGKRRKKRQRSVWVRQIFDKRRQQGEYHNLLQELRLIDPESHFRYLRMSRERFDNLLSQLGPSLSHRQYNSTIRAEISPAERLALTIRYLATGNSQVSLSFSFRIGRSTVCSILEETCHAIYNKLWKDYVKAPSCTSDWEGISKEFYQRWNFPHCVLLTESTLLYNYLRTTESSVYCPPGYVDGEDGEGNPISGGWRTDDDPCTGMQSVSQTSSNRHSRSAADIRNQYKDYFVSPAGEVQWQYAYVRRTH